MSWHTTKSFPSDKEFSRYIRLRDKKCVVCGKVGTGPEGIFGLQASHFYSRGKWSVRYDPDNVDALCIACHRKAHQRPEEYEAYKKEQLGASFDKLTIRAWNRSALGSSYWKKLTPKQAQAVFLPLYAKEAPLTPPKN